MFQRPFHKQANNIPSTVWQFFIVPNSSKGLWILERNVLPNAWINSAELDHYLVIYVLAVRHL
jgi:hypothetical protein